MKSYIPYCQVKMKVKLIITLILIFLYMPFVFPQNYELTSNNKKAIKQYNIAIENYKNSYFDDAIVALEKSVNYDSNFLEAWLLMGDIYSDIHKLNDAIDSYNYALSIDSTFFPAVYYFLGNIYYEITDYENSTLSYKELLKFKSISDEIRSLATDKLLSSEIANELVNNPVGPEPKNIGYPVNTPNDEYINFVNTGFDKLMLTKRTKMPANYSPQHKEELYVSNFGDSTWLKPKLVNLSWRNSGYNMGTINFSTDGRRMYFTGCYWPDSYGGCDIYYSQSLGDEWNEAVNIGGIINTPNWESQPIISSDGQKLFFASKRNGGKGGSDIWMSIRLKNNQWSPPINLGDSINTQKDEMAPFLHADGNTLFYASNGHPGLGGYDLFVSRLDEIGRWSKAENIGYPTNSTYNEITIFSSIDGKRSWISSDRVGGYGKFDIYYFDNYENIQPEKLMYVEGTIIDEETKKPLAAIAEITNLTTLEIINKTISDPITGKFLIILYPGIDYAFNISKKGYLFHSENINLKDTIGTESVKKKFELLPIKSGNQFVLNNVYFDFNKHTLLKPSFVELDKLVSLMDENPDISIEILGHTDNVGTEEYNTELSRKRSVAVGEYLLKKGISKVRLSYVAKGSNEPIASNETEVGRAKNRRTEIVIR